MVKLTVAILGLLGFATARWEPSHEYSAENSRKIADSIQQKLLQAIDAGAFFPDFAAKLKSDLNEKDDSKRQLKQLSNLQFDQILTVLQLADPKCDTNNDGFIRADQLKCLNYVWRAYLP